MESDLTAAQLAEIVGPVRDLLPGWFTFNGPRAMVPCWRDHLETILSDAAAEAIAEAVLTRWLASKHHNVLRADRSDGSVCIIIDGQPFLNESTLKALVAAVVAARTEKK